MFTTFEEFVSLVHGWADVRGIYEQSTRNKQIEKFCEELGEYLTAETIDQKQDAIGDMVVCLINAARIAGTELRMELRRYPSSALSISDVVCSVEIGLYDLAIEELYNIAERETAGFITCCNSAWRDIKDRRGMMVAGKFVKWQNLNNEQRAEVERREQITTL